MNDYEPYLGIYDMRQDTTDMPKELANKLNKNICCGGGSKGSTSTVSSGIDPEFKPDLQKGLGLSTKQLQAQMSGEKPIIADMTPQQLEALSIQERLAKNEITGRGNYDLTGANQRDLEKLYGNAMGQSAFNKNVGSTRSTLSNAIKIANASSAQQRLLNKERVDAANRLANVGTSYQKGQQAQLDATSRALDDYFNRLTGAAPKQSTTTQTGGK